jgi:hypothetical protein
MPASSRLNSEWNRLLAGYNYDIRGVIKIQSLDIQYSRFNCTGTGKIYSPPEKRHSSDFGLFFALGLLITCSVTPVYLYNISCSRWLWRCRAALSRLPDHRL